MVTDIPPLHEAAESLLLVAALMKALREAIILIEAGTGGVSVRTLKDAIQVALFATSLMEKRV